VVDKQPRNSLTIPGIYKSRVVCGCGSCVSLFVCIFQSWVGNARQAWSYFRGDDSLLYCISWRAYFRHEHDAAENNLLDCIVASENSRLRALGILIKAIIQVQ
jgi:hypothetical protein